MNRHDAAAAWAAWEARPALRTFWHAAFGRLSEAMAFGPTLHLLTGPGFFAAERPGMLTTDRATGPGILCVCTPEALPFPADTFACIVGLDVLGRSARPARVLTEAERVLVPGGRLVLVEPWTGPFGRLFHGLRHKRRVQAGLDPWFDACPPGSEARGNAATATACLAERADELGRHVPGLRIASIDPFGGPSEWLADKADADPAKVHRRLHLEARLPCSLRRILSTRVLCVVEKTPPLPP